MTNNTYIPIVFPAGFQKGFSLRYFYILGERLPCLEYGISRQETWQSSEKLAPSIINNLDENFILMITDFMCNILEN